MTNLDQRPGCLARLFRLTPPSPAEPTIEPETPLPFYLRDDFLSPAELSFYHVLKQTIGQTSTLCVKVSLGDLFYAKSGDWATSQAYRNKINRKHVDFLLCDPQTMRPLLGIELDDASHHASQRQARITAINFGAVRVIHSAGGCGRLQADFPPNFLGNYKKCALKHCKRILSLL